MPDEIAQDELMNTYEKWDRREERRNFITRMERKLHNKEHRVYRSH